MSSPLLVVAMVALTAVALGAVVAPLLRRGRTLSSDAGYDRAVYRDQLQEVERDVARGVLDPEQAASARLEIERRLLSTAATEEGARKPAGPAHRRVLLGGAIALVAAVWASGAYLVLGRPDAPDMPFASRATEPDAAADAPQMPMDVEAAANGLEAKLEATGGDVTGWQLLARTKSALRHWDKAANAYRHLIPMMPEQERPELNEAYGELLVLAAQGIVTPEAGKAFADTLAHQPDSQVARYYVALGDAQAGDAKSAIDRWLKLAGELPADSDMRAEIEKRVAEAAKVAGIAAPPLPPPAAAPPAKQ